MRLIPACLLASLLAGPALAASPELAKPAIVGGEDVPDGRYPFLASLQVAGTDVPRYGHICGASLISASWALTAAHCVRGASASRLFIRTGETDLEAGTGTNHPVAAIHIHPAYTGRTNDVALLKLKQPVEGITPVRLPRGEGTGYEVPGRLLTVAGWGRLSSNGDSPSRMQHVEVPFIDTRACRALYEGRATVDLDREMCASRAGKDSCQGDSGGPLFVKTADGSWSQLGVVSWGIGCARGDSPGVYARLASAEIDTFIHSVWTGD